MTSPAVRRVAVPLAVALVVLAVIFTVLRLADPAGEAPGGAGAGGGLAGSEAPGTTGTAPVTPSVVPPEPGPEPSGDGPAQDQRMSRFVRVAPGSEATLLEVRFWGGVETCYEYEVRADETGRTVRLTLVEKRTAKGPCIELAQQYDRTVHLQRPLDDRRVVDAQTGETVLAPTT
jgi:hypothetical protein